MRLFPFVILSSLFLVTSLAQAAIVKDSLTFSNASVVKQVNGQFYVYGGIAGDETGGNCSGATSVCDNCGALNEPCNNRRIVDTTILRIEFKSDNASLFTGNPGVFILGPNDEKIVGTVGGSLSANSVITLDVPWSQICSAAGAGADCSASVDSYKSFQVGVSTANNNTLDESETFQIFIGGRDGTNNYQYFTPCPDGDGDDPNGGFCYMRVERGDGKVYITDLQVNSSFAQAPGGILYKYLRVYYAEGPPTCSDPDSTFETLVTSASTYKDLSFTEETQDEFTLDDSTITGLRNDARYFFRFANVDEAGNVLYFSGDQTSATVAASYQYLNCNDHSAVPGEVTGLLDSKECFIATAAYGSSMAPQLKILREFRDRFLKSHRFGRWLVTEYYHYSPIWAKKIKKNRVAKKMVRATLSPVIAVAQWMILYGLQSFLLLSSIGFLSGFFIIRRLVRDND